MPSDKLAGLRKMLRRLKVPKVPMSSNRRIKLVNEAISVSARVSGEVESEFRKKYGSDALVYSNEFRIYAITAVGGKEGFLLTLCVNHNDQGEPQEFDHVSIDSLGNTRVLDMHDQGEPSERFAIDDLFIGMAYGDVLIRCVHQCAISTSKS